MNNPFAPNLVPPPRGFSIRRAEEAALRDRLKGPARMLIEGPRRTGKTSLVRFSVPEKELLAIDWKNLSTPREALVALNYQLEAFLKTSQPVRKLLGALGERGFSVEASLWGGSLKAALGAAQLTDPAEISGVVGRMLSSLDKVSVKRRIVLYFDEIQDLAATKEGLAFLGQLRGHLQLLRNVPIVFSGSVRSLLDTAFYNADSPFYRQYEALPLAPVELPVMRKWLVKLFGVKGIRLTDAAFEEMGRTTNWIIGDVQRFGSYLWNCLEASGELDSDLLQGHLGDFIAANRTTFETYIRRYTPSQKGLLRAIAYKQFHAEVPELGSKAVSGPFGYDPGIVPNALRTFEKDKITIDDPQLGLRIDDPFFAEYLHRFWKFAI